MWPQSSNCHSYSMKRWMQVSIPNILKITHKMILTYISWKITIEMYQIIDITCQYNNLRYLSYLSYWYYKICKNFFGKIFIGYIYIIVITCFVSIMNILPYLKEWRRALICMNTLMKILPSNAIKYGHFFNTKRLHNMLKEQKEQR